MSTTDRWQQAKDQLAARRAKVEAGTQGPWEVGPFGDLYGGDGTIILGSDDGADPNLIVAAVNDYSPLLDIAEGVLDRHAQLPTIRRCRGCNERWPCSDVGPILDWLEVGE